MSDVKAKAIDYLKMVFGKDIKIRESGTDIDHINNMYIYYREKQIAIIPMNLQSLQSKHFLTEFPKMIIQWLADGYNAYEYLAALEENIALEKEIKKLEDLIESNL